MHFEQWQVLVRGCVQDHIRLELLKHLIDPPAIADVCDHDLVCVEKRLASDVELELMEVRLVMVEKAKGGRLQPPHLTAQFAADGATRARDENPLVHQHGSRRRVSDVAFGSSKQRDEVDSKEILRASSAFHRR
jgi:hypothetical protein